MIQRLFFVLFFHLMAFSLAVGQEHAVLTKLKTELSKMSNDALFKYGMIGFSFRSADGKVIYEFNGDKSLTPASNLKLLTTATALEVLGGDFKFETKLSYDGVLKDGILNGNLYIEGSGDPTLGSDRIEGCPNLDRLMNIWVEKIKQAKIIQIKGSIVAEYSDSFNPNPIPGGWIWNDIGNYYGAGVSGLNINENLYKLVFKPGKVMGDSTQILRTEPYIPGIKFENQVKTGAAGSGDNAYIYGAPFSNYRFVNGTIPAGVNEFAIKGSVPDPALLTANLLYKALIGNGIVITGQPGKAARSGRDELVRNPIYTHSSPLLKDIIRYTNVYSINLYAESLFLRSASSNGMEASTAKGVEFLTDYWKRKGIDVTGMTLYDGSGLSPQTAIRPSQMTQMLHMMSKDSIFFASLPVAGETGTLKKLCKDTPAQGKVFAKSGTLSNVVCYSGYIRSKGGKLNSFSIMVNNYNGTNSAVVSKMSSLLVLMMGF